MLRIFKKDGAYSYELSDKSGIILSGDDYESIGDIQDFVSRLASATTEAFRNIVIEES